MKKLILFLLVGMFMISLVSAWDFSFDNFKTFDSKASKYGKITIWDRGQIGDDKKLTEITLLKNTDLCFVNCHAEGIMTLHNKGKLIENLRFDLGTILNYEIFLKQGDEWVIYEEQDLNPGTYEWRIEGTKNFLETVDWIATWNGFEADEWLLWSGGDAPVSYYRLDNSSGDAYDMTRTNDGTITGTLRPRPGKLNTAYEFPATTDKIDFNVEMILETQEFTVNTWVKPNSNTDGFVASQSAGATGAQRVSIRQNGLTSWRTQTQESDLDQVTATGTTTISTARFQMVTAVRNSTSLCLYVNATIEACALWDGTDVANSNEMWFGTRGAPSSSIPINATIDETGIWNRSLSANEILQLYNGGAGLPFGIEAAPPIVTLNIPKNNTIVMSPTTFNASVISTVELVNISLYINGTLNETVAITGTVNGSSFSKNLVKGFYNWTALACSTLGGCDFSAANFTFTVGDITENQYTFNASSFETESETFHANITTNGSVPSAAKLIYDGTSFMATITNTAGDNYNLSRKVDIPTTVETKLFFFNVTVDSIESKLSTQSQIINLTNFTHCSSPPVFMNISFRNETLTQGNVTATIASTWNYWLGDNTVFKTLAFPSAVEKLNYSFCLIGINKTLKTNLSMTYDNSISQQRSFDASPILTNTTLNQVLFLLPTASGLFQVFNTLDAVGVVVANVDAVIRRTIGGIPTVVDSGTTDDSGFISFFLNPSVTHSATFSKTGLADNNFNFFPSTTPRNVIMGGGVSNLTGSNITIGLTYDIQPKNASLNNNTAVLFSFNVTGNTEVTLISMNITNSTGTQFTFQSNAGTGFISETLNTGTNTTFRGEFVIQTTNETVTIQIIWVIGDTFVGDYSIFRQLTLYNTYGFSNFWRLLFVLVSILGILAFMTSTEVTDSSESKIGVALLMVWAFSIVGWLDTGLATSSVLSQFSNQYGVAILGSCAGFFFIFRRVFIRRI